ncbi:MAG: hypothetical protein EXR50_03270 [Dehalococcoidia bacterium]|nr:hypothetical protein [Dehalococcoidia bacterium]
MPTAGSKRPFSPEDFLRIKTPSDSQITPDGSRIAFVVSTYSVTQDETRSHIWMASIAGGPGRQFTNGPRRDHSPRWSPDGRALAFITDRGGRPQVWLIPADGGEARALTDLKKGVSGLAWAPDGTRMVVVGRTGGPDTEVQERSPVERNKPLVINDLTYKLDGQGYFDGSHPHLFVVNVADGQAQQITDGDWDDTNPVWSPEGQQIAFTSYREEDETPPRPWLVMISGSCQLKEDQPAN